MQKLPLSRKIDITRSRILEFSNEFGGNIYISFSGGKDSTVLLHIARQIIPDIPAVYVDTGLEYPEVRSFALSAENVTRLLPEMNFRQVIKEFGYPLISKETARMIHAARVKPDGKCAERFVRGNEHDKRYGGFSVVRYADLKDSGIPISDKCCKIMKKDPAKKYEQETGRHPVLGTMACESTLRALTWMQDGCNIFDGERPVSKPMSFWTEQDVLMYLKEYGIPYASVYGEIISDESGLLQTTGAKRTGCVFCGFGCHLEPEPNRFQRLKETHPKLWDYCMREIDRGGARNARSS